MFENPPTMVLKPGMRALSVVSLIVVLGLLVAGCGGSDEPTASTQTDTTTTSTEPVETIDLRVYLLRSGRVGVVTRAVPQTTGVARAALEQLLAGPTAQ